MKERFTPGLLQRKRTRRFNLEVSYTRFFSERQVFFACRSFRAISGARPGARREVIESYIKRLEGMENLAASYPGVTKSYAIQAGRELRVIVGADEVSDEQAARLSTDIAQRIQDEMTYPGQVRITVIRETRSVAIAK